MDTSPIDAPQQPASDPPDAVISEAAVVEEPCTLSSLPDELLKLVAENLVVPEASRLSAQSLARFAAASTMCLAAAQGALRAVLVASVEVMELAEVLEALRVHVAVAQVAEAACLRLAALLRACSYYMPLALSCPSRTQGEATVEDSLMAETAVIAAGALETVVKAMQAHPLAEGVQENGCAFWAMWAHPMRILEPGVLDADERLTEVSRRAVEAGALEVVVAAMQVHLQVASVQQEGCKTLGALKMRRLARRTRGRLRRW